MTGKNYAARVALFTVLILSLVVVPAALAGKGGNGKNSPASDPSTISLRLLNSTDGVAHYGQSVTFNVSAPVMYPWVQLSCSQSGTAVFGQYIGFYATYQGSQAFVLSSYLWPGGAADCTARLFDSWTDTTLATTSFQVSA